MELNKVIYFVLIVFLLLSSLILIYQLFSEKNKDKLKDKLIGIVVLLCLLISGICFLLIE